VVVAGNHDCNAPWAKGGIAGVVTNAVFLSDRCVRLALPYGKALRVHGCSFSWPMKGAHTNPSLDAIPGDGLDILVSHGPAKGQVQPLNPKP